MKKKAETKYELKCAGKRFFAVMLLIVFASVMLFGCGEENSEKEKKSEQKQEQSEGSSDIKADKGTGKKAGKKDPGGKGSEKKNKKDDNKSSKDKNKRDSKKEKSSKNKSKKNNGDSAGSSGVSQSDNGSSSNSNKGKKGKNNKSAKGKPENSKTKKRSKSKSRKTNNKTKSKTGKKNKTAKKYCWLKIQCKRLKGRKDLDPGTKSLVPKSGFILKKKKMEIKKGETVYSLITKARDKYRFALNVQDTAFGKYIAGIAGIEEKACGDESGWKYNVNGKYPDKSCSAVKVKAGDSIEWVYVLKANQTG